MTINAIREIYENAPETIQLTIPDSLRHRRIEVLLIELVSLVNPAPRPVCGY
jgi:hypothetical protein